MPIEDGDAKIPRAGERHQRFKYAEELSGAAKSFYEKVAEISALSVDDLVRTVYNLEQLTIQWARQQGRVQRAAESGEDVRDEEEEVGVHRQAQRKEQ